MRFGSVCSGIEAASVAWHPLGWQAAWLAEIEPFPAAVLKHHYPNVPNLGDMTTLPDRIRSGEVEAPDLFCGGTPCQAFSVAGLRKSLDDARGNLSMTFCEIANAIDHVRIGRGEQPCIVFWENVPGVLSTKDNAFGCFLGALAGSDSALVPSGRWTDAGVVAGPQRTVAWRTLDAQYFGVAQRRRRVFVVASAREGFDPAAVLLEWEGLRRDSAPSREAGEVAAPCVTAGAANGGAAHGARSGSAKDNLIVPQPYAVRNTLTARMHKGINTTLDEGQTPVLAQPYTLAIRGRGDSHNLEYRQDGTANALLTPNGGRGGIGVGAIAWDEELNASVEQAGTLLRGGQGGRHDGVLAFHPTQDPINSTEVCHAIGTGNGQGCATAAVAFPIQECNVSRANLNGTGTGIGQAGDPMFTLQAAQPHGVASAMQVRRLTPVECERLQGFPDGYTAIPWRGKPASECPDGPRYKALGNSWAVPVVRWIGHRIAHEVALSAR